MMKTFEFPGNYLPPQNTKKSETGAPNRPASGHPKAGESRGPGGGFFGGFRATTKNKKATLSKEQQSQKDQKLQQYRDILGVQGTSAASNNNTAAAHRTVQDNEWVIDKALKKANQNQVFKAEVIQPSSSNANINRPSTAALSRRQQEGEVLPVKQMRIEQDIGLQRTQGKQKQAQSSYTKTFNGIKSRQNERQKSYYQSQYHFQNGYQQDKAEVQEQFQDLVISGSEMHIDQAPTNFINQSQMDQSGYVKSYNQGGGKQAKAIVNTLKQPNASRFFKGYADRLAKHYEDNQNHYKSLYGESFLKENDQGTVNKTTAKKSQPRPSTAKSAFPNRGTNRINRNASRKSIGGGNATPGGKSRNGSDTRSQRSLSRKASARSLKKIYGEQNEQLLRYEKEKELIRKRDETKAELKALLKKYITQQRARGEEVEELTGKGNICAQRVSIAQHEMDGMHLRMDKAVYDINHLEEDFNQTKGEGIGLSEYVAADHFRAEDFEKNIDRNLKQARMAWQEAQAQTLATLNERMREKYGKIFEDPSRLPYFDEKTRMWEVSSKFRIEDNDDPDFQAGIPDAEGSVKHPFLEKML